MPEAVNASSFLPKHRMLCQWQLPTSMKTAILHILRPQDAFRKAKTLLAPYLASSLKLQHPECQTQTPPWTVLDPQKSPHRLQSQSALCKLDRTPAGVLLTRARFTATPRPCSRLLLVFVVLQYLFIHIITIVEIITMSTIFVLIDIALIIRSIVIQYISSIIVIVCQARQEWLRARGWKSGSRLASAKPLPCPNSDQPVGPQSTVSGSGIL